MNRLLPVSLLTAAALAVAGCGDGDKSSRDAAYKPPKKTSSAKEDKGDFVLQIKRGRGDDKPMESFIRDQEPEGLVDGLNENFRLPRDVGIIFETIDDEDTSPFYDPSDGGVHIPYEFVYETIGVFLTTGSKEKVAFEEAVATLEFVIYHEVGHALTDVLRIPVTGREEDAVDGLATAILTLAVDEGADSVLTAADWFAGLSELGGDTIAAEDFADVHSLDDQRFFSLLCWVYGSDPDTYAALVEDGDLPKGRAAGCPDEYVQNVASWVELLDPWLKE